MLRKTSTGELGNWGTGDNFCAGVWNWSAEKLWVQMLIISCFQNFRFLFAHQISPWMCVLIACNKQQKLFWTAATVWHVSNVKIHSELSEGITKTWKFFHPDLNSFPKIQTFKFKLGGDCRPLDHARKHAWMNVFLNDCGCVMNVTFRSNHTHGFSKKNFQVIKKKKQSGRGSV